jgi:biotin carboxyl carrier protein
VKAGDTVKAGDPLMVMIAMKMEVWEISSVTRETVGFIRPNCSFVLFHKLIPF